MVLCFSFDLEEELAGWFKSDMISNLCNLSDFGYSQRIHDPTLFISRNFLISSRLTKYRKGLFFPRQMVQKEIKCRERYYLPARLPL